MAYASLMLLLPFIVVVCSQLLFLLSIFISNYSLVSAVSLRRWEGGSSRGRANCELSIVELLIVNCCLYFLGLFVSIVLTMLPLSTRICSRPSCQGN